MRYLGFITILIIAAALTWFALSPLFPPPDPLAIPIVPAGQEESLRQFELANASEQNGLLAEAQSAYGKAALAENQALSEAGRQGVLRVAERQANPIYRIWRALREPLVFLPVMLALAGLAYLSFPRRACYTIAPFTDLSADNSGKVMHLLVARRLEEAREVYQLTRQERLVDTPDNPQPASPGNDSVIKMLSLLGDPAIGPVTVPLSKSKEGLAAWRSRNDYCLTGQVYNWEETIYLDATVQHGQREEARWRLQEKVGSIDLLVDALAYQFLAHILGKQNPFQQWQTLSAWTDSLKAVRELKVRRIDVSPLIDRLAYAEKSEPSAPARRMIAFQLGEIFTLQNRLSEAQAAYQRARREGNNA